MLFFAVKYKYSRSVFFPFVLRLISFSLDFNLLHLTRICFRPQALLRLHGSGAELCLHIRSPLNGMNLLHTEMSPSGVTR